MLVALGTCVTLWWAALNVVGFIHLARVLPTVSSCHAVGAGHWTLQRRWSSMLAALRGVAACILWTLDSADWVATAGRTVAV